jgi:hypothetical protein
MAETHYAKVVWSGGAFGPKSAGYARVALKLVSAILKLLR